MRFVKGLVRAPRMLTLPEDLTLVISVVAAAKRSAEVGVVDVTEAAVEAAAAATISSIGDSLSPRPISSVIHRVRV